MLTTYELAYCDDSNIVQGKVKHQIIGMTIAKRDEAHVLMMLKYSLLNSRKTIVGAIKVIHEQENALHDVMEPGVHNADVMQREFNQRMNSKNNLDVYEEELGQSTPAEAKLIRESYSKFTTAIVHYESQQLIVKPVQMFNTILLELSRLPSGITEISSLIPKLTSGHYMSPHMYMNQSVTMYVYKNILDILVRSSNSLFTVFTSPSGTYIKTTCLTLPESVKTAILGSCGTVLPQFIPPVIQGNDFIKGKSAKRKLPLNRQAQLAAENRGKAKLALNSLADLPYEAPKTNKLGQPFSMYERTSMATSHRRFLSVAKTIAAKGNPFYLNHNADGRNRMYSAANASHTFQAICDYDTHPINNQVGNKILQEI